ncbi:apoptosis facilitator Bcl-2-like protein 14 [Pristis pectinata]|uniref:apoptosis facilitator Bcl-2-like protein 14 n=1 Tax=Pristis pectinata TaxID=685728 RepID=UPI00223E5578|nr:apoptosis facilitator Bcl-2-like protein 14 [Pristis pectinata]
MGPSDDAVESNSMSENNSADDNSFEFRILMAYAERTFLMDERSKNKSSSSKIGKRKANQSAGARDNVDLPHNVSPDEHPKVELKESTVIHSDENKKNSVRKSKRKPKWKRLIPRCLRAATSNREAEEYGKSEAVEAALRSSCEIVFPEPEHVSELDPHEVAEMLQNVMNTTVSFRMLRSPSLEVDRPDDDQKTIDRIVEFLTAKGDSIDEEIKKDPQFAKLFSEKSSFSFFKKVMDYALQATLPVEMNSEAESEAKVKLNKFALVVHATTKFAVAGNHPMARIMGFGTKYLQENFTTWVVEKGGWEQIIEEEYVD